MAERTTVARPYADAAFAIARERSALPAWSGMMAAAEAIARNPQMSDALANPKLSADDKSALFLTIGGDRFSPEMRNFVRVLIEARRIELLPEVRSLFDALRNEAEGVAQALIESAHPLSDGQVRELAEAMSRRLGKRVETTARVDPALIGGARISVGDTVIDGTVRGKLAQMRNALLA